MIDWLERIFRALSGEAPAQIEKNMADSAQAARSR